MKKISILHIIQKSSYDGASIFPLRLIDELPEYEHFLLAIFSGSAEKEIKLGGYNYKALLKSDNLILKRIIRYFLFVKYILTTKYDIIHYHLGGVGILLLATIFGNKGKVIHHIHSGNIVGNIDRQGLSIIQKYMLKYISNKNEQIAVSKNSYEFYKQEISKSSSINLIYNFSPIDLFPTDKQLTKRIGYLGRMTKEKGIYKILEVARDSKFNSYDFCFSMKGDYYLESDVNSLGKLVEINSPSLSIKSYLETVDLLLFLSSAPEAFPLSIIEAISMNVSIIAIKSNVITDILDDYPLLINGDHPAEILKIIQKFYTDKELRKKIWEKNCLIARKFNKNCSLQKLKAIYNN